jgi:hypothetical protein
VLFACLAAFPSLESEGNQWFTWIFVTKFFFYPY